MGTRDAYQNMMDDLQEKAQMIEWMDRHNVLINTNGWRVMVNGESGWHYYSGNNLIEAIREAMINHV